MGSGSKTLSRKKKYLEDESDSDYSSSSSDSDSETSSERRYRRRKQRESKHKRSSSSNSKGSRREREKSEKHRKRKERRSRKEKKVREDKHGSRRRKRSVDEESDGSGVSDEEKNPKSIVGGILNKFPEVVEELKQLLEMIDRGQAVDIRGISDRFLVKQLKKLFRSLRLKESDGGIYLLPQNRSCTMEVIGPMISSHLSSREQQQPSHIESSQPVQPVDSGQTTDQADGIQLTESTIKDESSASRRRVMGPEMPSSELLAAAAKLTEAEAELREAELEIDDGLFIGPAPPAVAAEAASANEAERFEEVTRIMGAEVDSPYDVLGVNHKMPADNMKKRYWKLSLMVHPDKCSHPQAHQAFVILNKAFKTLQDPDKRKAMDEKIKLKEEQEAFKAELQEMRKAAQWRRLQGISMEGDDELLAESEETKGPPKREEWMTTLPPERRPDIVSMHSVTSFSKTAKEGRGDTSVWTDTPADKAQKAKMSYLEAYNEAAALASNEDNKRTRSDAALVDQYNRTKRSKSLVEKHQEEKIGRSKKKSKGEKKKEEWEGQHPWKPWDRENDLTAGRQKVNLDPENMMKGLTSRFSSGNIQRNFL